MTYVTQGELDQISEILTFLSERQDVQPLSVEVKFFDSNGDVVGFIRQHEGTNHDYTFSQDGADDND